MSNPGREPLNEPRHIAARLAAGLTGCMKCRDTGQVDFPTWAVRQQSWRDRNRKLFCHAQGCDAAMKLIDPDGSFAKKFGGLDLTKGLKTLLDAQEDLLDAGTD